MSNTKIGICVPTVRIEATAVFLERWTEVLQHATGEGLSLAIFIHEDAPVRQTSLNPPVNLYLSHTSQEDLKTVLSERHWIIPRGSGACRSFPMYLAWKEDCDFIITLDDDCYPPLNEPLDFLKQHLDAFRLDRWFRTVSGLKPRGIPYSDCGTLPVLLNHGVWSGVPDLDGPTSLTTAEAEAKVVLRAERETIPPGMFFPLCAMNVCYHRSAIPAAYNLLMGRELCGFDRFDDIWSGLFLKRIADHLGLFITNGPPFIDHVKASNPFSNNHKEALGIQLHEFFWKHIAAARLTASDLPGCYAELADWVVSFPEHFPEAPDVGDYFERLGEAMHTWLALFQE